MVLKLLASSLHLLYPHSRDIFLQKNNIKVFKGPIENLLYFYFEIVFNPTLYQIYNLKFSSDQSLNFEDFIQTLIVLLKVFSSDLIRFYVSFEKWELSVFYITSGKSITFQKHIKIFINSNQKRRTSDIIFFFACVKIFSSLYLQATFPHFVSKLCYLQNIFLSTTLKWSELMLNVYDIQTK